MNMLEKQLRELRAAYATGRSKPVLEISDRNLPADQQREPYTPISSDEQAALYQCSRYHTMALQNARRGEYALADELLAAAEHHRETAQLSAAGSLVAQSAHESIAAYLDYRREDFATGIARIYGALAIDETLEESYGCVYFHAHRIRLLLNLIRLKRRQNERETALRMGFALLDYLEQKTSILPFPTNWDTSRLAHLSLVQQNFFFEQAISELSFLMVGQAASQARLFNELNRQHTHPELSMPCQLSPRGHLWLQARQALQAADIERLLTLATPLVAAGPADALWLWYGILMDLSLSCKELPLNEASLFLQEVTVDMASWKWAGLPPAWRLEAQQLSSVQIPI